MDTAELHAELLLCARYGELDELRAALQAGADINHVDSAGSSALHMACANGHADVAEALLDGGAEFGANDAGNTPLHWAVQNEHEAVVAVLLVKCDHALVLAQNKFGKSALTEAFGRGSAAMLNRLLEHTSAAALDESGASAPATEGEAQLPAHIDVDIVHAFELAAAGGPVRVGVRELGGAAARDDDAASAGRTQVSASAIVLARWLVEHAARFVGARVLELDAGCGLPGLALAAAGGGVERVLLAERNDGARANLAHSLAALNSPALAEVVEVVALGCGSDYAALAAARATVLLGAQLARSTADASRVLAAAHAALPCGGRFAYCGQGEELEAVHAQARSHGFAVEAHAVPDAYLACCLGGEGAADAFDARFARPLRAAPPALLLLTKLPSSSRWAELPGWARVVAP